MTSQQLLELDILKNELLLAGQYSQSEFIALCMDMIKDRNLIQLLTHEQIVKLFFTCSLNEPKDELILRLNKEINLTVNSFSNEDIISILLFLCNHNNKFVNIQIPKNISSTLKTNIYSKTRLFVKKKIFIICGFFLFLIIIIISLNSKRNSPIEKSDFSLKEICNVYEGEIIEDNELLRCQMQIKIADEKNLTVLVLKLPFYEEIFNIKAHIKGNNLKLNSGLTLKIERKDKYITLFGKENDEEWNFKSKE